jgi:hypothetical protein
MKMITAAALIACATQAHAQARAWDGETTGAVDQIEAGTANDGILIYQSGVKVMCNKGTAYAVISENEKNGKTIIGLLMSSKMLGEPVVIYTTNVGGVCRIGHVKVSSSRGMVN